MTEKEWKIIDEEFISYTGGTAQLISNGECKVHLWETPKDAQLFCDKLNEQHEQIEDLKDANVRCCNEYSYFHKRMMELEKENEQLKTQLQNVSDQRDEFHRGARENANRVGKLENENEQLKQQLWNTTIDYYTETYSDNSIRRDEHINEFKKEFKAKYGDVE